MFIHLHSRPAAFQRPRAAAAGNRRGTRIPTERCLATWRPYGAVPGTTLRRHPGRAPPGAPGPRPANPKTGTAITRARKGARFRRTLKVRPFGRHTPPDKTADGRLRPVSVTGGGRGDKTLKALSHMVRPGGLEPPHRV